MEWFYLRKRKLWVGDLDPLFTIIVVTCTLVCVGLKDLEVAIVKIVELNAICRVSKIMLIHCWFRVWDKLGTIIAFNLNIIETTLGSNSDYWLISRVNWVRWGLLKEWSTLICGGITIIVWKNLISLLNIMRNDYLCICSRSFNCFFQITY